MATIVPVGHKRGRPPRPRRPRIFGQVAKVYSWPAVRFSETPAGIRRGAPAPGEHTGELPREIGYSDGRIRSLVADRIVGSEDPRRSP